MCPLLASVSYPIDAMVSQPDQMTCMVTDLWRDWREEMVTHREGHVDAVGEPQGQEDGQIPSGGGELGEGPEEESYKECGVRGRQDKLIWDFKDCRQIILELNSPSEQSHAKLPIHTIHTIHTPVQTDVPMIIVQALNDSSANSDRMC